MAMQDSLSQLQVMEARSLHFVRLIYSTTDKLFLVFHLPDLGSLACSHIISTEMSSSPALCLHQIALASNWAKMKGLHSFARGPLLLETVLWGKCIMKKLRSDFDT